MRRLDLQRRGGEPLLERGFLAERAAEDGVDQPARLAAELDGLMHRGVRGDAEMKDLVETEP